LILNRTDTFLAPAAHVAGGGKDHDTVKPLTPYFSRLHRVLLVDDDAHKSVVGEEHNMVLMPSWQEGDKQDAMVRSQAVLGLCVWHTWRQVGWQAAPTSSCAASSTVRRQQAVKLLT
jgi:hypothetical protein